MGRCRRPRASPTDSVPAHVAPAVVRESANARKRTQGMAQTRVLALCVLCLAAGRASHPAGERDAAFAAPARAAPSGRTPAWASLSSAPPGRRLAPPRAPAARRMPLMMSAGGGPKEDERPRKRTRGAGPVAARTVDAARPLDAVPLSRRAALGAGCLGLFALAAPPGAAGAAESAAVTAGPVAEAAKKEANPLANMLRPAAPNKAAEAEKKGAKLANELKTVDSELRKEYLQIKKDLQADMSTLENGLDTRLRNLNDQLADGKRRISTVDAQRLDKILRDRAQRSTRSIEETMAKIDLRIADLDAEIAKKKHIQDFVNKKKELAGQLRAAAKKTGDQNLQQKMLFEADMLEQDDTSKIPFRDQFKQFRFRAQQRVEAEIEPLLINNTKTLIQLEEKIPGYESRNALCQTQVEG